mgnify:CR=1 FL=1
MKEKHKNKIAIKSKFSSAILVLENKTIYKGIGLGYRGEATGEICFNTSLTGYQEIISDPSYAGQIINFTFPHIGNVGTNKEDFDGANPGNEFRAANKMLMVFLTEKYCLKALELKPNSDVLISPVTCSGAFSCITEQGHTPVLVDSDKNSYNISLEQVKKRITSKKIWIEAKNYDDFREIFADSATLTYQNGQTDTVEDFIKLNLDRDSILNANNATLKWEPKYALSVDIDPTRGGEHVNMMYLGTYNDGNEESQFNANLWFFVQEGKTSYSWIQMVNSNDYLSQVGICFSNYQLNDNIDNSHHRIEIQ